jgi:hypothetical protein
LEDSKARAKKVIEEEGIDLPWERSGNRPSARKTKLKERLRRIAEDTGSPRQKEAQKILEDWEQVERELGELNRELRDVHPPARKGQSQTPSSGSQSGRRRRFRRRTGRQQAGDRRREATRDHAAADDQDVIFHR